MFQKAKKNHPQCERDMQNRMLLDALVASMESTRTAAAHFFSGSVETISQVKLETEKQVSNA